MHSTLISPTRTHSIISFHLLTQISAFIFLHLLSPMISFYGLLWNPDPKQNKGTKLSEGKIPYRRWTTGSTSRTPLAVPSLQAQHPSPTSGKVVHYQGGMVPHPPPHPSLSLYGFRRCPTLPSTESGMLFLHSHKGLFLCKSTLCKGLILLWEIPFSFYLPV